MIRFVPLAACALLLAACTPVGQIGSPSGTPSGDAPVRTSEFPLDAIQYPDLPPIAQPDVRRVTLDNGLTVFLIEDRSLPTVNASARIGAGSLWEPADKTGLAGIAGSVMRSGGTASMSPDELNQFLEDRGASVETGIGSQSGFASMNALTETADEVLEVFADVLRAPAFDPEQVTIAQTQARTSIARRNDNPQQIAVREFSKALYGPDSPYARTPEYYTIAAIERDDLVAFHEQYVHPGNTMLAVWGDFDAAQMEARIRDVFGDWEAVPGFSAPEVPPATFTGDQSIFFVDKPDLSQSTVLIGHPGELTYDHPDYFAVVVMNEVLGGGFSGRMLKSVRQDLGLAYSAFGGYGVGYRQPGLFTAGTFTKSESTVEAARAMMDVIRGMQTNPPTEAEVQLAKDAYLNSFVFNFDSKGEVVNRLMTYEAYGYPADFLQQVQAGVQAVTAEDVRRVAQQYLRPDEVTILVLGNEAEFGEPVASLGEVVPVDITIPQSAPGGEAAAATGDADAGQALLMETLDALGGAAAFRAIETVQFAGTTTAQSPQGEIEIGSEATLQLPDRARVAQVLPFGRIEIIVNGSEGLLVTPQGSQPAPPAILDQVRGQLYQELSVLLAGAARGEFGVARLDDRDGNPVLRFMAPGHPEGIEVVLRSGRPVEMRLTAQTQQGPVPTRIELADYREAGGVMLPFAAVTYQNDEAAGSAVYDRIELNPELPADTFNTDG